MRGRSKKQQTCGANFEYRLIKSRDFGISLLISCLEIRREKKISTGLRVQNLTYTVLKPANGASASVLQHETNSSDPCNVFSENSHKNIFYEDMVSLDKVYVKFDMPMPNQA
jgi:hypothetical protein